MSPRWTTSFNSAAASLNRCCEKRTWPMAQTWVARLDPRGSSRIAVSMCSAARPRFDRRSTQPLICQTSDEPGLRAMARSIRLRAVSQSCSWTPLTHPTKASTSASSPATFSARCANSMIWRRLASGSSDHSFRKMVKWQSAALTSAGPKSGRWPWRGSRDRAPQMSPLF